VEEDEVKKVFKAYLDRSRAQYLPGKDAGPDFEFEDGSIAEAKGSEWADVGEVLRQIAEYYLKSPSVTFIAPSDSLNLDRAFRLCMLERIMKGLTLGGRAISVFLVDKVADNKYKVCMFDSLEDLWKEVTERIGSKKPGWYVSTDEKLSFVSTFSFQIGNELFRLHIISLVNERGSDVELKDSSQVGEGEGEEEVERRVKRLQEIMRECKEIIEYLKREEERRKKEEGG